MHFWKYKSHLAAFVIVFVEASKIAYFMCTSYFYALLEIQITSGYICYCFY